MQTIEVTTSQLKSVLKDAHAAKLNPFIQGQPGVGKSAVVNDYAKEIAAEFIDVRLAYFGPQDFGYPYLHENEDGSKTMRVSRPSFWPTTENPVIAYEEFNCCGRSVQNCALQLFHDRRLNDYKLPENTFQVLLGNRAEDRVNIEKLSSAVVNRIVNIRVRLDLDSWIKWAQKSDVDSLIIAFLRFRPDLLSTFEGAKWDGVSNFASPRTWEKASNIVAVSTDRHIRHALLQGALGSGAAAEFLGFLAVYEKLPDLDGVLLNPTKAVVPTKGDVIWATCAGLSKRVKPKTMPNFLTYLDRLPKEFAMFGVKTAVMQNKALMNTPAFVTWITDNQEAFN